MKSKSPILVVVISIFLLVTFIACNQTTSLGFSIVVNPTSITLGQTESVTVTVEISRSGGFSEAVILTLDNPPTGISGDFSPNPANGDTSELEITVSETASLSSHTLSIQAEAAGKESDAELSVTVTEAPGITVEGMLIDIFRKPLVGITVHINNTSPGFASMSVTTDALGRFSVANIKTPYNVVVFNQAWHSHVFLGLNAVNPVLQVFDVSLPEASAQVYGQLTGATFPNPAQHNALVTFASPEGSGRNYLGPGQGPAYATLGNPLELLWSGPSSTSGRLHGLQWQADTALFPLDYTGYGNRTLSVNEDALIANINIDLSDVREATLTGSVVRPDGYIGHLRGLYADWGPNSTSLIVPDIRVDPNFSYVTPDLSNATMTLVSLTCAPPACTDSFQNLSVVTRTGLAPDAENIALNHANVPELLTPEEGGGLVSDSTVFSWTPSDNSIYLLRLSPTAPDGHMTIVTRDTSVRLSDYGVTFLEAMDYDWYVIALGPYSSLDSALHMDGYLSDYVRVLTAVQSTPGEFFFGTGPEHDGVITISAPNRFSTGVVR